MLLFVGSVGANDWYPYSTRFFDDLERKHGKTSRKRVEKWQSMISEGRGVRSLEQSRNDTVNDFFNQLPWVTDQEHWGQDDYWATPLETLVSGAGDCEDFSIGKYFTLKALGTDISKLRITYVKHLTLNEAHMVLAYYPDASIGTAYFGQHQSRIYYPLLSAQICYPFTVLMPKVCGLHGRDAE